MRNIIDKLFLHRIVLAYFVVMKDFVAVHCYYLQKNENTVMMQLSMNFYIFEFKYDNVYALEKTMHVGKL